MCFELNTPIGNPKTTENKWRFENFGQTWKWDSETQTDLLPMNQLSTWPWKQMENQQRKLSQEKSDVFHTCPAPANEDV